MQVCTTTENGKKLLGRIAREAREAKGWSLRDVARILKEDYGLSLSIGAISDLEVGMREPQWNTLARLVALEYIINPHTEQPYSISDLFKIACEALDPETGLERETAQCNNP